MLPPVALQVTPGSAAPVTVAVNGCCAPAAMVAVAGDTVTTTPEAPSDGAPPPPLPHAASTAHAASASSTTVPRPRAPRSLGQRIHARAERRRHAAEGEGPADRGGIERDVRRGTAGEDEIDRVAVDRRDLGERAVDRDHVQPPVV